MALTSLKNVRALVLRIFLGQALSFFISMTGLWSTLLVNNSVSYPIFQSLTSYLFIFVIYFPAFIILKIKYRNQKFVNFRFLSRWWKYAILGLIDLEANYAVISAYNYTNLASVQLLNCFTLPCVLVLSYLILRMKFALTHIFGCIVAICGLALLVVLDADGLSHSSGGTNQVIGDLLCLLGSFLYALNNVTTEWFIKPPKTHPSISNEPPSTATHSGSDQFQDDTVYSSRAIEEHQYQESLPQNENEEHSDVPVFVPIVEYLALMSFFALIFSIIHFFAVEWKDFYSERKNWTGNDYVYQVMFGVTMLGVYTAMPSIFLLASAAFANISLLSASVYAIIWNSSVFHIYPTPFFVVSYIIIFIGILLYNITDIFKKTFSKRWNYPCQTLEKSDKRSNINDNSR
ncbi:unnamed protein product [Phytomonas sp. EM1]|nr:unnamed protein product [Phytomonas sp. EM1]|eukprot:CCW59612.1 unnamed protein product [Phytomonas sp. isolate EM1]